MTGTTIEEQLRASFPHPLDFASYVTHYSHRFAFVYVETPKVSCSTIKRALQLIEVDWDAGKVPAIVHDRAASPLPQLADETVPLQELFSGSKYFRFAFVRNPFTRSLSAYLDKIVENEWERERLLPVLGFSPTSRISFREFLTAVQAQPDEARDIHWMTQAGILKDHLVRYDLIGRFENFATTFDLVLERISAGSSAHARTLREDHHKTNAAQKVREYVGNAEREMITQIYQEDFRRFCYSSDPNFASV